MFNLLLYNWKIWVINVILETAFIAVGYKKKKKKKEFKKDIDLVKVTSYFKWYCRKRYDINGGVLTVEYIIIKKKTNIFFKLLVIINKYLIAQYNCALFSFLYLRKYNIIAHNNISFSCSTYIHWNININTRRQK